MRSLSDHPHLEIVQPGRIHFGVGALGSCASILREFGCRDILVLHARSVTSAIQPVLDSLRVDARSVAVLTGIPAEPDVATFERLRDEIEGQSLDAVIGIGGGSVLDIAKLFAALHGRDDSVRTFFGQGLLPARRVRLICVPTTSGAGSEVSPNAILYDEADRLKKAVISAHLVPDVALVDPNLTITLPPATTAATGLDALVHCIEAYANLAAHPMIDPLALEGMRLISRHLVTAVRDGHNLEARSAVALGSLYGGLCLGPVNTAAVHALAYPLGSEFRLAHGLSNALLLTHVLRFNLSAAPARYAAIARSLGASAGFDDLSTAKNGLVHLDHLIRQCGLPSGLAAVGVTAKDIPGLAAAALRVTRLLRNNPRPMTQADAEEIFRQAL